MKFKGICDIQGFQEIPLGENNETKTQAIKKYTGNLVLLKDAGRQSWFYGTLLRKGYTKENYTLRVKKGKEGHEDIQLPHHNLEYLLVPYNSR